MHKSALMQYRGMPWKTPALSRNGMCYWVWFYLPSATTSSKHTFTAATSCFLCKSSSYVCGRIYLWAWLQWECRYTSHSFSRVSPRSPAVTHQSLLFHITYFEFHHLYRPLGIPAPQGFPCKEPMYGLWCIVSLTRKKYLRFKPWFALNFKQSITGVSSVGEATIQCPVEVSEVSPVVYFFQSSAMIQKVFKTSIKGNIRQKKENWCIIPLFENLPW